MRENGQMSVYDDTYYERCIKYGVRLCLAFRSIFGRVSKEVKRAILSMVAKTMLHSFNAAAQRFYFTSYDVTRAEQKKARRGPYESWCWGPTTLCTTQKASSFLSDVPLSTIWNTKSRSFILSTETKVCRVHTNVRTYVKSLI